MASSSLSCQQEVSATISNRRERFQQLNEITSYQQRLAHINDTIEMCTQRRDIRRRQRSLRERECVEREIVRRKTRSKLFNTLVGDVQEAVQIANANRFTTRVDATPPPKPQQYADDANLVLGDVMLIYDGDRLQDARAQVDDVCSNCHTLMERNLQLSYLICPNLECQYMRWYMDTSTYSSSTYNVTRMDLPKNAPKCVTHYATFLNTCQGKTTKKFAHEYLMKICFYCYVVGARKPEDITKEMINRAQKYTGITEYNISTILKTLLRGNSLRLPPDIIKKMQLLFKAVWPVFASMKMDLDTARTNMINFNFVSRVFCRLLGYDVFLPLFDKFRMPKNEIKHSAFMREMFAELGWVWENLKLTDIPDSVLDEMQAREEYFYDNMDDEDD